MPYRYVVSVDSKGFNEAPPPVMHCLSRLTWAARQVAGNNCPPNELLAVGYFEEMAMNVSSSYLFFHFSLTPKRSNTNIVKYHDDGESSLGPTIATLSIGGKARMVVRLKDKYYRGRTAGNKLIDDDPVMVSCEEYEQRMALKHEFDNGSITLEEYNQRRSQIYKTIRRREAHPIIELDIEHGDLVIQHGEDLQKYYEVRRNDLDEGRLYMIC